jgi:hypothetical protein
VSITLGGSVGVIAYDRTWKKAEILPYNLMEQTRYARGFIMTLFESGEKILGI